jgi:hypothetical protein
VVLSPPGSITLVSQLRENLLLCSSFLPLGVPNGVLSTRHQAFFLAPLPGRKKISARGVSHAQSFEGIRSIVNQKFSYGSEQESQDLI